MQNIHDIHTETLRLARFFDDLPAGCDPDFDAAGDDLEREFAELRLQLGKPVSRRRP
jgi:hypothetical protein